MVQILFIKGEPVFHLVAIAGDHLLAIANNFDMPLSLAERYNGFTDRRVMDAFIRYGQKMIACYDTARAGSSPPAGSRKSETLPANGTDSVH
jgi:hypothetical protein